MPGEIKSLIIPGPAGRLEALLNTGDADATHAALVRASASVIWRHYAHKVVFALPKALNGFGFPTAAPSIIAAPA